MTWDEQWGRAIHNLVDAFKWASEQPHVEKENKWDCIHCLGMQFLRGGDDSDRA